MTNKAKFRSILQLGMEYSKAWHRGASLTRGVIWSNLQYFAEHQGMEYITSCDVAMIVRDIACSPISRDMTYHAFGTAIVERIKLEQSGQAIDRTVA